MILSNAQIRDLGIVLNQPLADNWIQKIRPRNSAVLKVPGDNGVKIAESDKVMIDDIFLVQNGDDYFILQLTDVVVTATGNNDHYEFIIKKSRR